MADKKFSVYGETDPAYDDFVSSITKRLSDSGVKADYLKYANAKDLFDQVTGLQKDIGTNPRVDVAAAYKKGPRVQPQDTRYYLTPAEEKTNTTYGKYDSVRDRLKRNFGETATGVDKAALGKAIDETLIEMRNKQYVKPEQASPAAPTSAAPTATAGEPTQKEARLGVGSALFPEGIKMPETTPMTQEKPPIFSEPKASAAPTAKAASAAPAAPAAPAAGRDFNSLFMKATGTEFDPKSRLDVARKAELEDLLKSKPELAGKSDTQIALQWYRQMENAKRK